LEIYLYLFTFSNEYPAVCYVYKGIYFVCQNTHCNSHSFKKKFTNENYIENKQSTQILLCQIGFKFSHLSISLRTGFDQLEDKCEQSEQCDTVGLGYVHVLDSRKLLSRALPSKSFPAKGGAISSRQNTHCPDHML
jgi:hypothetical protein